MHQSQRGQFVWGLEAVRAYGLSAPGRALYIAELRSTASSPLGECKILIATAEIKEGSVRNSHSSACEMSRPFEKSKAVLREIKHRQKIMNHNNNDQGQHKFETTPWIPHPRTGIYYPKGHERVMEGIPKGAALFKQTHWLRNFEGTDKPIADPCTSDIFEHPFLNM